MRPHIQVFGIERVEVIDNVTDMGTAMRKWRFYSEDGGVVVVEIGAVAGSEADQQIRVAVRARGGSDK